MKKNGKKEKSSTIKESGELEGMDDVVLPEKGEERVTFRYKSYKKLRGAVIAFLIAVGVIAVLFVVFALINAAFAHLLPSSTNIFEFLKK